MNRHNGPSSSEPARKYPIRCVECGEVQVRPAVIRYETQRNHDGRLYALTVPELRCSRCRKCGEVYFDAASDEQILAALRDEIGLLSPEFIAAGIQELGLTQKEFADYLGVAPETVSRWLNNAVVHSRLADNAMRWFFGIPAVREAAGMTPCPQQRSK